MSQPHPQRLGGPAEVVVYRPCKRGPRQHGTVAMYRRGGCDCTECVEAARRSNRRNSKLRAMGRSALVDAAPVREHVQRLIQGGMTPRQIEDVSGVHRTAIRVLLGDFPNRKQSQRVRPDTARALMSVRSTRPVVNTAMIDATGTRRRLQALLAIGYTSRDLARRLGASGSSTSGLQIAKRSVVRADTARAVAELYRELENTPGPSRRAETANRARGYLPPAWWDEDTIDDPAVEPGGLRTYVDRAPVQRRKHSPPSGPVFVDDVSAPRTARVSRMAGLGFTPQQIAERTGIPLRYVRRDLRSEDAC